MAMRNGIIRWLCTQNGRMSFGRQKGAGKKPADGGTFEKRLIGSKGKGEKQKDKKR